VRGILSSPHHFAVKKVSSFGSGFEPRSAEPV
jgi:hypothetical protein